jgi:CDP-diacylglycerol--glycerol-3-phosphate 3-phosphatidyltransferase
MRKPTSINVQKTLDGWVDKIFLRFFPQSVKPNQVTAVRFILVPVVYALLLQHSYILALIVFAIAALTDLIDGAMARTRNQITDLGKVIDPVADKLLIISVLIFIGFRFLIIKIFVIYIIFEMFAVVAGYAFSSLIGGPIGANFFGKIKLNLQVLSIGLFILGIIFANHVLIRISVYVLFAALVFAVFAAIETIRRKVRNYLKNHNINVIYS